MGTPKRERQKANRAQRDQELAQQRSRARTTRIALIVGGAIVAVFLLVWVAGRFVDDDDDTATDDAAVATTAADPEPAETSATAPPTEAPVLTEPEAVEVPTVALNENEVVPDGCPPIEGTEEQTQNFDEAPPFCLDPAIDYTAVMTTNLGTVEIDLDQEAAPNTVNSFVFLARNNYFDDTICHRIIQDFVVQCGDPTATGTGGPGYTTADELPEAGAYQIGSVAMANSGPDTQGSQFFIVTGPNGEALPPSFSLFGQVREEDFGTVAEMDARGSTDASGQPQAEVRIIALQIATA